MAHCALRTAEHLVRRGHEPLVVAPAGRPPAPSSASVAALTEQGVPRVFLGPRGVDPVRFPPARRDPALRRALAPRGELIVGSVGRLAAGKHVDLLAATCALPGVRVVAPAAGGPLDLVDHGGTGAPGRPCAGSRPGPSLGVPGDRAGCRTPGARA